MSDAPETIWAQPCGKCSGFISRDRRPSYGENLAEYRRTDLPPTPAQIMADPRVQALVEALRFYAPSISANGIQFQGGDDGGHRAAAAIAALEKP